MGRRRFVRTANAKKRIKCASCKKRIPGHEPDLELTEVATDKVRYFHTRCERAVAALILKHPTLYALNIRRVDASRN